MVQGKIIFIGGEENNPFVYRQLFPISENTSVKLAVITAIQKDFESFKCNTEAFFSTEVGLPKENITIVQLSSNQENFDQLIDHGTWNDKDLHDEIVGKIKECNVVIFTGQNIPEYFDALKNNNIEHMVLAEAERIFKSNGVIIATGSNASALCSFSIFDTIAIDTNTDARGRFNRLCVLADQTKKHFAVGLSENTAAAFNSNRSIEVFGFGDILVTDLKKAKIINSDPTSLHVRNATAHLFSHGDIYNLESGVFIPFEKKESIKNTPYFDFNDYHVSLNVFKDYETSHILVNYVLDSEAKDVIAIMDYDLNPADGDSAMFLHYVEQEESEVWYCKHAMEQEQEELDFYSGTNILLNIIPVSYIQKLRRPDKFNSLFFGINNDLQVIVYDTTATMPVLDAKIYIFDSNGKLVYKKGTDRYGRALLKKIFTFNEQYLIKIVYENERKEKLFVYSENMPGICLF